MPFFSQVLTSALMNLCLEAAVCSPATAPSPARKRSSGQSASGSCFPFRGKLFFSVCHTIFRHRNWNNASPRNYAFSFHGYWYLWLLRPQYLSWHECVPVRGTHQCPDNINLSCLPECQPHFQKLSNLSCNSCMPSVLPASGFGVEEQSQESQKTMKRNWSATLNELGFKEVFIYPWRILPAKSDWLVLSGK